MLGRRNKKKANSRVKGRKEEREGEGGIEEGAVEKRRALVGSSKQSEEAGRKEVMK